MNASFHIHVLHRAVGNGKQSKSQNENICLRRESNQRPVAIQPDFLLRLKLFQNHVLWITQ